jgi:hypothetical protein
MTSPEGITLLVHFDAVVDRWWLPEAKKLTRDYSRLTLLFHLVDKLDL